MEASASCSFHQRLLPNGSRGSWWRRRLISGADSQVHICNSASSIQMLRVVDTETRCPLQLSLSAACVNTRKHTHTRVRRGSRVAEQGGGFPQPPRGAENLSLTFLNSISESTRATAMMSHDLTSARDQGRKLGGRRAGRASDADVPAG